MTKKIAILTLEDGSEYSNYDRVITSITDWAVVSDEDHELIKKNLPWGQKLLVCPENQQEYVLNTVEKWLAKIRADKAALEAKRAKQTAEREAKRLADLAKNAEKERKMYEALKQKFETTAD